jgi:hypothetical protein
MPFLKTSAEGAQTQIFLAIDPDLENVTGMYFDNCAIAKISKAAQDEETAEWLFEKSLELVGLKSNK